jgi:hypothetical protein
MANHVICIIKPHVKTDRHFTYKMRLTRTNVYDNERIKTISASCFTPPMNEAAEFIFF